MTLWSRTRSWLRDVLRLSYVESEMDAELRSHIEAFAEDLVRGGMPVQEAMRRARIEFGSIEQTKEDCRNARGINVVESIIQDLRYALRTQRRSWGFTAVAVPTLALGIGAATAIVSVVKAVILDPMPFRQPENLVHVWEGHEHYHRGDQAYFSTARPGSFYDWRERSRSFESISAYRWRPMLLTDSRRAELVSAQEVYDQFFETLGTPARLGRTLQATDYEASASHVVVIGNTMWVKRFGGNPGVIGRRISLDRESYEVVGVMPAGFYPFPGGGYPELWIPHWANQGEKDDRTTWGLFPVARLKAGITWQQAQIELDVTSARMSHDHPTLEKMGGVVVPMDAQLIGSSWKLLLLLAGAVALLLLIACVNVANLLLARAVDREKEFAIRTALGAARGRLVLQLFTESVVFAVGAGVVGIGVASAGTRALLAVLPRAATLPRLDSVKIDFGALAFVCALTFVASLLFCFIPLIRASRGQPHHALTISGRGFSASTSKRRLGQVFVVSEFVFSLVLLILGVLLVEGFVKLQRVDPGFDASNLLVFKVAVPDVNYGNFVAGEKNAPREKLYEQLEQRINDLPGVDSVGFTGGLPLTQAFNPWPVRIEGREPPPSGSAEAKGADKYENQTAIQVVNPQYFHALRVKLVSGRLFDERDSADAPKVAVVNEAFARSFFPNDNPIDKQVTVWFAKTAIVGVVSDFKLNALDRKTLPEIFWSIRQMPTRSTWIMARAKSSSSLVAEGMRQEIQDFDSDLPVLEMQSMNDVISDSLWLKRLSATLVGVVSVLAMMLAGAGIYSVMSYSVSQRRKEVGIRVAFGANRRDVFGLIMGETCRLAILGCVLGCTVAFIAGHLAIHTVYLSPGEASSQSQDSLSPAAFILSSLFLLGVAICASLSPARRALRVDPMVALQHE
jgi:predicted permease